jgi:hypothetical protein
MISDVAEALTEEIEAQIETAVLRWAGRLEVSEFSHPFRKVRGKDGARKVRGFPGLKIETWGTNVLKLRPGSPHRS